MQLDLRKYIASIAVQIAEQVGSYDPAASYGPGECGAPIHRIVLGFQFYPHAWVALIFDTRPDADPVYDGEWQGFIEENLLDCDVDAWSDAAQAIIEDAAQVTFRAVDGSIVTIGPHSHDDEEACEALFTQLAGLFGDVVREVLLASLRNNFFAMLPLASPCLARIDEHECAYAWPDCDLRGTADDPGRIAAP